MKEYEVVHEIFNECANNQMRDVFFEEVMIEDLEAYIRGKQRPRPCPAPPWPAPPRGCAPAAAGGQERPGGPAAAGNSFFQTLDYSFLTRLFGGRAAGPFGGEGMPPMALGYPMTIPSPAPQACFPSLSRLFYTEKINK